MKCCWSGSLIRDECTGFIQGTYHIGKPVVGISHVVMQPRHHEPHLISSQWLSPYPRPGYLLRPASEEHTLYTGLFHVCRTDMFSEGNYRHEDTCSWERQTCVLQKVEMQKMDSGLLTIITVWDEKSIIEMMTFCWTWHLCTGLRKCGSERTHWAYEVVGRIIERW